MGALWSRCELCGAVVADQEIHERWHVSHGEQVADGDEREEAQDPGGVGDVGEPGDDL